MACSRRYAASATASPTSPEMTIPTGTGAGGWSVHPAYLIDALEACRVVLDSVTGGVGVQTPEDGFSAVRVHAKGWLNDGEVEVVCVVMPMRL